MKSTLTQIAALSLVGAVCVSGNLLAETKYAIGTNINLCFSRGAMATSSPAVASAFIPLWGYGGDVRMAPVPPTVWWQVRLDAVYKVEQYYVGFYEPPYSTTNFSIRTSVDGITWTTQVTYVEQRNPSVFQGSFPGGAVDAKYVRVEAYGADPNPPNSYGCILRLVKLYGPNDPDVTTNVSLAQAAWNLSSVSPALYAAAGMIDGACGAGYLNVPTSALPHTVDLTLGGRYAIRELGFCGWGDNRSPKDIDVYGLTSASNWVPLAQARNLPISGYIQTLPVTEPMVTDKLRYVFLSNNGGATVVVMEVLVFGTAPPRGTVIFVK